MFLLYICKNTCSVQQLQNCQEQTLINLVYLFKIKGTFQKITILNRRVANVLEAKETVLIEESRNQEREKERERERGFTSNQRK